MLPQTGKTSWKLYSLYHWYKWAEKRKLTKDISFIQWITKLVCLLQSLDKVTWSLMNLLRKVPWPCVSNMAWQGCRRGCSTQWREELLLCCFYQVYGCRYIFIIPAPVSFSSVVVGASSAHKPVTPCPYQLPLPARQSLLLVNKNSECHFSEKVVKHKTGIIKSKELEEDRSCFNKKSSWTLF